MNTCLGSNIFLHQNTLKWQKPREWPGKGTLWRSFVCTATQEKPVGTQTCRNVYCPWLHVDKEHVCLIKDHSRKSARWSRHRSNAALFPASHFLLLCSAKGACAPQFDRSGTKGWAGGKDRSWCWNDQVWLGTCTPSSSVTSFATQCGAVVF